MEKIKLFVECDMCHKAKVVMEEKVNLFIRNKNVIDIQFDLTPKEGTFAFLTCMVRYTD